jgi:hypothetical protein
MRLTLLALVLGSLPLAAQQNTDIVQRIADAVAMPYKTDGLRMAGVSDQAIVQMIRVLQNERVAPRDIANAFDIERTRIRDGGRPENFGAFVQEAHARGLRGQALAAEIRDERTRRNRSGGVGVGSPPAGRGGASDGRGGPPAGRGGRGGRGG